MCLKSSVDIFSGKHKHKSAQNIILQRHKENGKSHTPLGSERKLLIFVLSR